MTAKCPGNVLCDGSEVFFVEKAFSTSVCKLGLGLIDWIEPCSLTVQ
jgi:hypothetical protein